MDIRQSVDQVVGPIRPFLYVAGVIIIVLGLLRFFQFADIGHLPGTGLELAFAGFMLKSI